MIYDLLFFLLFNKAQNVGELEMQFMSSILSTNSNFPQNQNFKKKLKISHKTQMGQIQNLQFSCHFGSKFKLPIKPKFKTYHFQVILGSNSSFHKTQMGQIQNLPFLCHFWSKLKTHFKTYHFHVILGLNSSSQKPQIFLKKKKTNFSHYRYKILISRKIPIFKQNWVSNSNGYSPCDSPCKNPRK